MWLAAERPVSSRRDEFQMVEAVSRHHVPGWAALFSVLVPAGQQCVLGGGVPEGRGGNQVWNYLEPQQGAARPTWISCYPAAACASVRVALACRGPCRPARQSVTLQPNWLLNQRENALTAEKPSNSETETSGRSRFSM